MPVSAARAQTAVNAKGPAPGGALRPDRWVVRPSPAAGCYGVVVDRVNRSVLAYVPVRSASVAPIDDRRECRRRAACVAGAGAGRQPGAAAARRDRGGVVPVGVAVRRRRRLRRAVSATDPTGDASAWTVTDVGPGSFLTSISCPSVTLCVAADSSGDVTFATTPAGGAWAASGTSARGFGGISCPSVSLCVAVGTAGEVVTSSAPTGDASQWTGVLVDQADALSAESCPTAGLCAAIDLADVHAARRQAGCGQASDRPTLMACRRPRERCRRSAWRSPSATSPSTSRR